VPYDLPSGAPIHLLVIRMPVHPFLLIFVVISVHVDGDLHNDTTIRAVLAKKIMLQLQAIVITDHINFTALSNIWIQLF